MTASRHRDHWLHLLAIATIPLLVAIVVIGAWV